MLLLYIALVFISSINNVCRYRWRLYYDTESVSLRQYVRMIVNVLYDSMHQFVCHIDYDSRMVYLTSPFSHTFTSDSISEMDFNDAYYSKQQHIIEDVGYFGGEIYAFSLMAVDIYGNKYGAFPCTCIDHYYANKESDLDYEAYEPCGGLIAEPITF